MTSKINHILEIKNIIFYVSVNDFYEKNHQNL